MYQRHILILLKQAVARRRFNQFFNSVDSIHSIQSNPIQSIQSNPIQSNPSATSAHSLTPPVELSKRKELKNKQTNQPTNQQTNKQTNHEAKLASWPATHAPRRVAPARGPWRLGRWPCGRGKSRQRRRPAAPGFGPIARARARGAPRQRYGGTPTGRAGISQWCPAGLVRGGAPEPPVDTRAPARPAALGRGSPRPAATRAGDGCGRVPPAPCASASCGSPRGREGSAAAAPPSAATAAAPPPVAPAAALAPRPGRPRPSPRPAATVPPPASVACRCASPSAPPATHARNAAAFPARAVQEGPRRRCRPRRLQPPPQGRPRGAPPSLVVESLRGGAAGRCESPGHQGAPGADDATAPARAPAFVGTPQRRGVRGPLVARGARSRRSARSASTVPLKARRLHPPRCLWRSQRRRRGSNSAPTRCRRCTWSSSYHPEPLRLPPALRLPEPPPAADAATTRAKDRAKGRRWGGRRKGRAGGTAAAPRPSAGGPSAGKPAVAPRRRKPRSAPRAPPAARAPRQRRHGLCGHGRVRQHRLPAATTTANANATASAAPATVMPFRSVSRSPPPARDPRGAPVLRVVSRPDVGVEGAPPAAPAPPTKGPNRPPRRSDLGFFLVVRVRRRRRRGCAVR